MQAIDEGGQKIVDALESEVSGRGGRMPALRHHQEPGHPEVHAPRNVPALASRTLSMSPARRRPSQGQVSGGGEEQRAHEERHRRGPPPTAEASAGTGPTLKQVDPTANNRTIHQERRRRPAPAVGWALRCARACQRCRTPSAAVCSTRVTNGRGPDATTSVAPSGTAIGRWAGWGRLNAGTTPYGWGRAAAAARALPGTVLPGPGQTGTARPCRGRSRCGPRPATRTGR